MRVRRVDYQFGDDGKRLSVVFEKQLHGWRAEGMVLGTTIHDPVEYFYDFGTSPRFTPSQAFAENLARQTLGYMAEDRKEAACDSP